LAPLRSAYGRPFAWLTERAPRSIAVVGVILGAVGGLLTFHYVASDPMEYDMWNTRNESPNMEDSSAVQLGRRVDKVVGRQGQDGLAIMTDRVDQVLPLKTELLKRRDAAPTGAKPFDSVVTVFDLLPTDQDAKIKLIVEARDR